MEINSRKSLKKRVCVILIAFLCIQGVFARTEEKHIEPNGFIWYENIELISPNYGKRLGYYSYVYDINGHNLFGKTRAVTFHCIDANDEGQFTVQRIKGDVEDLYSRNGELIFKPTAENFRFSKRFRSGDKYYYEVYQWSRETNTRYGVIDDKGNQLVPIDYRSIESSYMDRIGLKNCLLVKKEIGTGTGLIKLDGSVILKPEYYMVTDNGPFLEFIRSDNLDSYTLTTPEGEVLVRDAKKIISQSWASRLKITMPNHTIGYLDYNGNWLVSPDIGYTYIDESSIGADKSYCKVGKNGMRGILDSTQKEILPCEFEDIEYIGGDFFKFKSGDFWGVINVNGKIIIPTSRGYSTIGKYSNIQKTFPFTKTGYKGECNHLGRQISLIKTENNNPKAVFTKINGNKSNSKTGKSNTQETVVSTPTKKSNNIPMVFHYTKSGRGQSLNTGEWTDGIDAEECNVEFFAKYIIVNGQVYDLVKTKGPWKIYGGQSFGFGGHNDTMYYYVDDNKNMKQICEFSSPFGFDTFVYPMSRNGDPTPTDKKDSNIINKTRNGESSHTSSVKIRQSTCSHCNGAGVVEKNDNAPSTFGNRKPKQQCKECGKWYDPNLFIHYHQICRHCNGTGVF